jgi:hypothetical protein
MRSRSAVLNLSEEISPSEVDHKPNQPLLQGLAASGRLHYHLSTAVAADARAGRTRAVSRGSGLAGVACPTISGEISSPIVGSRWSELERTVRHLSVR